MANHPRNSYKKYNEKEERYQIVDFFILILISLITIGAIYVYFIYRENGHSLPFLGLENTSVKLVKNGLLSIDQTRKVGDVFEKNKLIKKVDWRYFDATDGRKVVEAICLMDSDQIYNNTITGGSFFAFGFISGARNPYLESSHPFDLKAKKFIKDIVLTVQFLIYQTGKEFVPGGGSIDISLNDPSTENIIKDIKGRENFEVLNALYEDKFFVVINGSIFPSGIRDAFNQLNEIAKQKISSNETNKSKESNSPSPSPETIPAPTQPMAGPPNGSNQPPAQGGTDQPAVTGSSTP